MKKSGWINHLDYKYYKSYDKIGRYSNLKNKVKAEARFHFDDFDLEDMNYRIRKLPRIFLERYEQDLRPTMPQIKVMKRNYKVFRKTGIDKTGKN